MTVLDVGKNVDYGDYYIANGVWIGTATLKNTLALLREGDRAQAPRPSHSNHWLGTPARNALSEHS